MTARRRHAAGLLLVLAGLMASTGCGGGDDVAAPDTLALQRAAEKAAVQAAEKAMTYNFATIDADFAWVEDLATEKFQDGFDEVSEPVRTAVEAGEVDARAVVMASATDYEDPTHVSVLLFVDQEITSEKDPAAGTLEQLRVQMDMVREDGDWLVDAVEVVNRTTGGATLD